MWSMFDFSSVLICFYDMLKYLHGCFIDYIYKNIMISHCVYDQTSVTMWVMIFYSMIDDLVAISLTYLHCLNWSILSKIKLLFMQNYFFLLPNQSVFRENNEAKISCYLDENFDTYFASFILMRQGV